VGSVPISIGGKIRINDETSVVTECTMPKRQAVVIFPEVNYELSLVMENVKRESWRRSTSSPKIGILVLIMHIAWSPNTNS
jgi:hypothetical protein